MIEKKRFEGMFLKFGYVFHPKFDEIGAKDKLLFLTTISRSGKITMEQLLEMVNKAYLARSNLKD